MKQLIIALMFFLASIAYATENTPVGYWISYDDETHEPRCMFKIAKTHHEELSGKIYKIWFRPGENPNDRCTLCTGDLHDQPMLGLNLLRGFTQENENTWSGGTIVDPTTGSVYRCTMTVSGDGKELYVRGYIGISLFGRTQTWGRAKG